VQWTILAVVNRSHHNSSLARLTFAQHIRKARLQKGWSQERLADESKLHRNYVGSVERGERNISIDNMEKLAKALGTSLSSLLESRPKR
jgi:transcriptional regulator with XRE-family HTH domain